MWKGYHLLVEGTRKDYTFSVKNIWYTKGEGVGPQCGSSPYKTLLSTHLPGLWVACEQALLFGLRRLLARSGETCFARLDRRACLQAKLWAGEMASYTRLRLTVHVVLWSPYDCSGFSFVWVDFLAIYKRRPRENIALSQKNAAFIRGF